MLPDVERGEAPGVTKFENGSRIDAEPRPAPAADTIALAAALTPGPSTGTYPRSGRFSFALTSYIRILWPSSHYRRAWLRRFGPLW